MPTVKQIVDILPHDCTITLVAGWELIAYQSGGTDELFYGHWIVTAMNPGRAARSYELDVIQQKRSNAV